MRGTTHISDLLKLIYTAVAAANLGDNAASGPLTNIQVGLHATWPGAGGNQTTGELSYTGYGRVAVARTTGGWTVTSNSVSPVGAITFGACTGGSGTANFFSTGSASTGTGKLFDVGVIGGGPKMACAATSDTITAPSHGLAVNDPVVFWSTLGNALPTGITEGTVYYVKTAPDSDTFTISTTAGGSTLDITGAGVAVVQKITPITITSGVTPILNTSTAIIHY